MHLFVEWPCHLKSDFIVKNALRSIIRANETLYRIFYSPAGSHLSNLRRRIKYALKLLNTAFHERDEGEFRIAKTFEPYFYGPNEHRKRLFANLDQKSVETAEKVLARYDLILHKNLIDIREYHSRDLKLLPAIYKKIGELKKRIKLPTDNYEISVFYYHSGLLFVPQSAMEKTAGRDFIDCGAFIGDSAAMFETFYSPRSIYAFEPEEKGSRLLQETIKANGLAKTIPIQLGVSNKTGTKYMSENAVVEGADGVAVKMVRIDDFADEKKLDIGLIKMDIEGHESAAIEGAASTIKKFRPVLLIAIYHCGKDFFEIKPFIEKIAPGYEFIIRHMNPIHPTFETFLIGWPK